MATTAKTTTEQKNETDTIFEMGAEAMVAFLENPRFQTRLVKKLNENIDIPFINESTEESIIRAICTTVVDTLKDSFD